MARPLPRTFIHRYAPKIADRAGAYRTIDLLGDDTYRSHCECRTNVENVTLQPA